MKASVQDKSLLIPDGLRRAFFERNPKFAYSFRHLQAN
jgi:hypothetical protein